VFVDVWQQKKFVFAVNDEVAQAMPNRTLLRSDAQIADDRCDRQRTHRRFSQGQFLVSAGG
jgi:hypothetical protein